MKVKCTWKLILIFLLSVSLLNSVKIKVCTAQCNRNVFMFYDVKSIECKICQNYILFLRFLKKKGKC